MEVRVRPRMLFLETGFHLSALVEEQEQERDDYVQRASTKAPGRCFAYVTTSRLMHLNIQFNFVVSLTVILNIFLPG